MQIILMEKIKNLGNLGDKVNVKPGYGRNFLIPQGKAVFATEKNVEIVELRRADLEKKALQLFAQAEQRASKLNDTTVVISAQASDEGKLYGSVGPAEIHDALLAMSIEVSKHEIAMPDGSLHSVGYYVVHIHVHSDIVAKLHVEVVAGK